MFILMLEEQRDEQKNNNAHLETSNPLTAVRGVSVT